MYWNYMYSIGENINLGFKYCKKIKFVAIKKRVRLMIGTLL